MSSATAARATYEQLLESSQLAQAQLHRQHVRLVWWRMGLFVLAALGLLLGYGQAHYSFGLLSLGWLAAAGFLVAIVWHEHVRLAQQQHTAQSRLYLRLLARLDRNWNQLPEPRLLPEFHHLSCADDLDVAGPASLLSLVSLVGTLPGRRTLHAWLADNPTWDEVQRRQRAVQHLMDHRELRLTLFRTVLAHSDGSENVYGLPTWAASPDWLPRHRAAHALSYVGPGLVAAGGIAVALAALLARGQVPYLPNLAVGLLSAGLLINLLVTVFWGSWIHDIFHQVTGTHHTTAQFANVFRALDQLPSDGGYLDRIRRAATQAEDSAVRGFEKLLWLVRLANLQRDPLMYVLYLVLQLSLLWDFRVLKALEKWKGRFGGSAAEWFEALGICEALMSSATLADEHRSWVFPQPLDEPGLQLRALGVGHPLLADTLRVENDLTLATDRPLLLVTGSNMAGKSTFLRTIGLNLLLARIGSPVCARQFETHLYELATSIRVRDSLRDGVSFFMAELQRLKQVVDLAQRAAEEPRCGPVLFLLDEILQGTNSRERQVAVTSVVQRLLGHGACGMLSTHDLDLADVPEMAAISQVVHFHEYFQTEAGREVMRFDYKMRPGPTPTTNALKLLQMVGLN